MTENVVKFKDKFAVLPQAVGGSRLFLVGGWRGTDSGLKMNSAVRALWMQNVRSTVLESSARSRIKKVRPELSYNFK